MGPPRFKAHQLSLVESRVCKSAPILFMADTNILNNKITTGEIFLSSPSFPDNPLAQLVDYNSESPYTCCGNDTGNDRGDTEFAMDRIAVTATSLVINSFYGGALTKQGTPGIPGQSGYVCGSEQEHAPLVATISFGSLVSLRPS